MPLCQHCLIPFETDSPTRRYCAPGCKARARERRKRVARKDRSVVTEARIFDRVCGQCGEQFVSDSPRTSYCSVACRATKVGKNRYVIRRVNGRLIAEHRLVMEAILGRPLEEFENVHHLNGVRSDNRPENLELWTKPQPIGQRPEDLARWVVEHYPAEVFQMLFGVDRVTA